MGEVNEFMGKKVGGGGGSTEGRRGEGGREKTNEDIGADGEEWGEGGRQMEEGREGVNMEMAKVVRIFLCFLNKRNQKEAAFIEGIVQYLGKYV